MKFWCWLRGHDFYVIRRFSPGIRKVGCHRCKGVWGMHDGVRAFVEWDGDLEDAHRWMAA